VTGKQSDRHQPPPVGAGHVGPTQSRVLEAAARELGVELRTLAALPLSDANSLAGGKADGASLHALLLRAEASLIRRGEQDGHGHFEC
jgi:hypothetical protein